MHSKEPFACLLAQRQRGAAIRPKAVSTHCCVAAGSAALAIIIRHAAVQDWRDPLEAATYVLQSVTSKQA